MPDAATSFDVREVSETTRVIDIRGDITAQSEDVLMDAYGRANGDVVRAVVLNFTGLDYMNSGGIGLLVTVLVRAQRQRQRVLAYGRQTTTGRSSSSPGSMKRSASTTPRTKPWPRPAIRRGNP